MNKHEGYTLVARIDMDYRIEFEQEVDGRWIAAIVELPGVMAYGASRDESPSKVQAIVIAVSK